MTERNEVLEFLDELVSSDEDIRREAEKERVRLALALGMVRARKARGLSQVEVAKRLGVTQSWVSKLENPDIAHTFESIIDYLQAIGAELDMVIRTGTKDFTVSQTESRKSLAMPDKESGSTIVERFWEGVTADSTKTLVPIRAHRNLPHLLDTAQQKPLRRTRYPQMFTTGAVASEATSSGYGGSHDVVD